MMARKRKRRSPSGASDLPADPSDHPTPPAADLRYVEQHDHADDLGTRVQFRLDADIGLDHSLPPDLLNRIAVAALVAGLAGLALTVPAAWVTWSRLLVTTVGAFLVWVAATATHGHRACDTIWFTGGAFLVLALLKWIGLPAFLPTGPGGVFVVASGCVYAVSALAWAGSRSGPAALLDREVCFVKRQQSFQDELDALSAGYSDARAPVVLQCARCAVVFPFYADRIILSPINVESLEGTRLAWMQINRCGANFEVHIEEPVTCPRCETADDYVYAEHPAQTLKAARSAGSGGPVVHGHITFTGAGRPEPVLERWMQLKTALEADEDAIEPRVELARLYRWVKLGGLAREQCQKALDLDEKCVPAWTLMAELMRDRGEDEAAHMLITDAVLGEGDAIARLMEHPELQAALMRHARRGRGRRRR